MCGCKSGFAESSDFCGGCKACSSFNDADTSNFTLWGKNSDGTRKSLADTKLGGAIGKLGGIAGIAGAIGSSNSPGPVTANPQAGTLNQPPQPPNYLMIAGAAMVFLLLVVLIIKR